MRFAKSVCLIVFLFFSITAHGQQWRDVGGGADGQVYCLYHDTVADLLYVGGNFEHLGGNTINQIGVWNGANWTPVGNNALFTKNSGPATIRAIAFLNGDLIVAGLFDTVAGLQVNNVARWDGVQWHSMGSGLNGRVRALMVYNGELYVGGDFTLSGSDPVYRIAKWNGFQWIQLGTGPGVDNYVNALMVYKNKLIVSGMFSVVYSSLVTGRIVSWDGTNWSSMNGAFNDEVFRVRDINDTLYAVGPFTSYILNPSNYLSKWNGSYWEFVLYPSGGSQPQVNDIALFENEVYVCGLFTNPPVIGRFNGNGYDPVGNVSGVIVTMIVYNNELYVAGGFTNINGVVVNSIARFSNVVGIDDDNYKKKEINVYPNPVARNQTLKIEMEKSFTHGMVSVVNAQGENLLRREVHSGLFELKLPVEFESGVYYLIITDSKGAMKSSKLIVL